VYVVLVHEGQQRKITAYQALGDGGQWQKGMILAAARHDILLRCADANTCVIYTV